MYTLDIQNAGLIANFSFCFEFAKNLPNNSKKPSYCDSDLKL